MGPPCTDGPLVLVFAASPLLEHQAVQGALGPLDLGRLCRTCLPVPAGSGPVADAFFAELLYKLDTKSCSEIAQPPAPSGKLSTITVLIIN